MKKNIKNQILKKALALWVICLLVFNPLISVVAFAEDITPTPTPDSSIITGEAQSQTDNSANINSNTNNIPGTVIPGGCTPDINTGCTDPISNQNQADITSTNDSSAQTGQNSSSDGNGDVSINTGEATASAQTSDQINTNIVNIIGEATESAEVEEATPSGSLSVSNQNDAKSQNEMSVSAGTGENFANNNQGSVNINSGDALAIGNMFNLINTNILGSNVEILVLNLTDQQGDINLFQVWKDLTGAFPEDHLTFAGNASQNSLNVLISNQNQAELNNNLQVTALSGKNEANNNSTVNLISGDASAIANVTNVVNTNMVGSKLLFVIVNVLGSYTGNLILPRREYFESTPSSSQAGSSVENNNGAVVNNDVKAEADSGNDQISNNSGDSNIQTGDAEAVSRSLSFLNLNFSGNNWFNLIFNNLGSQNGSVLGWSNSESVDNSGSTDTYSTNLFDNFEQGTESGGQAQIQNFNQVKINNQISASAVSGQNQANGNGGTDISTGNAKALANLLNLANLNILGSNLFFGAVNILGNWQGNTVFAYPDVTASISGPQNDVKPGDEIIYTINFKNKGFDNAHNVYASFEMPKGTSFISDTSGLVPVSSGNKLKWNIGDLSIDQGRSFEVHLRINPNLNPEDLLSFWDKLIPVALAAEEGRHEQVTATVTISTSDPESDSKNDSSAISTIILFPISDSNQNKQDNSNTSNTNTTILEISAKNNVNKFIYQGDTITFNLEIKNTGNEIAKNVTLSQNIYDGHPESTGSVDIPLGDIPPQKTAKITFAIQITDLKEDSYHTEAVAYGDNVSSNKAITNFDVKEIFSLNFIPEVKAQENNQTQDGEVKGAQACALPVEAKKEWWPYALMAMFATLWFLEINKRKQWDTAILKILGKIRK